MARRQTVVECVLEAEEYDGSWPFKFDSRLIDAIALLQSIQQKIPDVYLGSAICRISCKSGYEDNWRAHLEITYERPETAEEAQERINDDRLTQEHQRLTELHQLRMLQAKYPQAK